MTRSLPLLVPATLLSFAAALGAQQTAEASAGAGLAPVRAAYASFRDLRSKLDEESRAAMQAMREQRDDPAVREKNMAILTENRRKIADATEAFAALFRACDWEQLDTQQAPDADVLREGLSICAAESEHDADRAVRACEMFLEVYGDDDGAKPIRQRHLAHAYLAAGKAETAAERLRELAEQAAGPDQGQIRMMLGDVLASRGDSEAARAEYEKARELVEAPYKPSADLRLSLVGKPAPDIATETWIGGEAKALSAHQGQVVVVDFWATWCGPCRAVMPALNALYQEKKADGLAVLGLTRVYPQGYLPANPEQMRSGGESVEGMDEAAFLAHVKAFRDNTGIAYPFLVGTQADFESYQVKGIPTVAIVDKKGNVAMVVVGSGSEALIRSAVESLLAL